MHHFAARGGPGSLLASPLSAHRTSHRDTPRPPEKVEVLVAVSSKKCPEPFRVTWGAVLAHASGEVIDGPVISIQKKRSDEQEKASGTISRRWAAESEIHLIAVWSCAMN